MSATRLEFQATLVIASPVMCAGPTPVGLGVDASFLRDQQGAPIVSADHVKGLSRDACRLIFPNLEISLFGPASQDSEAPKDWEPIRSRIVFSDFVAVQEAPTNSKEDWPVAGRAAPFTRIQIDDETGSAKDGHLQVIEMIAEPGVPIEFSGSVVVFPEPREDAGMIERALRIMLGAIPAVGAFKSIGFGEVLEVRLALASARSLVPTEKGLAPDRLQLMANFDRPVLFDAQRVADNVFRGATVAPGAVIKGALATRLERAGLLASLSDALAHMRISHAFPLSESGDPTGKTLPLSLVQSRLEPEASNKGHGQYETADVLLCDDQVEASVIRGKAAILQPDWKPSNYKAAADALGWPGAGVEASIQQTRTAVGEDGVAADQQLFVYQAIPSRSDGALVNWGFEVIRGEGISQQDWQALTGALTDGLDQVGKTDASMKTRATISPPRTIPAPFVNRDRVAWAITLETPALLVDMAGPWDAGLQYGSYWASALDLSEAPKLESFFAWEMIRGGYQALRRRSAGPGTYSPWLVTKPGSVFLLSVSQAAQDAMTQALETALLRGLPLPPDRRLGRRPSWQECPFVPENGYGAIAFHHDIHARFCACATSWRQEAR